MTNEVAKRKVLGLVGLGLRGRLAVVGVQQVRDAAKRGKLKVALVASDASKNSLDKVSGVLKALEVPVVGALSAAELGGVAGREAVAVIGVTNAGLARGIMTAIPAPGFEATEGGRRAARPSSRGESRR
jgi:ribosomal protein L7Ae-like RNA K-turn-binding protein